MILPSVLFSTPAAALATLAGAASIPIIIHLLNRRRYRIVEWAAMRFLLAAKRQNVRRLRLEQSPRTHPGEARRSGQEGSRSSSGCTIAKCCCQLGARQAAIRCNCACLAAEPGAA